MYKPKVYIKDNSFDSIYKSVNYDFYFKSRVLSAAMLAAGTFVLATQVVVPLVFFKTQDVISDAMRSTVLGIASGFNKFSFDELKSDLGVPKVSKYNLIAMEDNNNEDFSENPVEIPTPPTQQKNVLGTETQEPQQVDQPEVPVKEEPKLDPIFEKYFYLSIPKLRIDNALVEINSPTLTPDRSLGHYAGSSLPGQFGNSFIYGHSVLPWFYNPKNYLTMFATLDKLNPGDTFNVVYKGKAYNYKVVYTEVLAPSQVDPLAEFRPKQLNESTITLMTCWPAGMKSKRLMVRALLIK